MQKKRGDFKFIYENSSFFLISFIIGARIGYIALNTSYYFYELNLRNFMQIFAIWDKGFSFWGGVISMLISIYYKTHQSKESFRKWMDYFSEPFLYALPIAYIGKFFDGMGYGAKTDLPFGIAFQNMDVAIISPVHPTQLYSVILFSIGILITKKYFKKKPKLLKIPSYKAIFIIGIISTTVFIENLFRGDPTITIFGIRIALYLCFIITITSCINLRNLQKKENGLI